MNETRNAFNEPEAARYLGVSQSALRFCGVPTAQDLAYFRAGSKLIRYLWRDLDGWIEARLRQRQCTVQLGDFDLGPVGEADELDPRAWRRRQSLGWRLEPPYTRKRLKTRAQ